MPFSLTKYHPGVQRSLTLTCIVALLLGLLPQFVGPGLSPAHAAATVSLDPAFNVGSGFSSSSGAGIIRTLVTQSDGKILAGGFFSSYNGISCNSIVRLNSDGTLDNSFSTGTGFSNGLVIALAIQNDGKIVVGGTFSSYKGTAIGSNIVRLNSDGSLDNTFNTGTGFDSSVNALAIQNDGKIMVGGYFFNYNGTNRSNIARINSDGTLDSSFSIGLGFNGGVVNGLAIQNDGKIVAVGAFSIYSGIVIGRNIARLNSNGMLDSSFNTGTGLDNVSNNYASNLVIQSDGKIVVSGNFTIYNGTTVGNNIARINSDGTLDNSFSTGTGFDNSIGPVNNLSIQSDGKIVAVGAFRKYNGGSIGNNIARLNTNGTLDINFSTGTGFSGGSISSLAIQSDGKIMVGGRFTSFEGTSSNFIARLVVAATPVSPGSFYHKVTPFRLYDDRPAGTNMPNPSRGVDAGAFKGGETRTVSLAGVSGLPATGITAITANLTVVSAGSGAGFVTAFPTTDSNGLALTRPGTANLVWSNPTAASLLSNFATISVDSGGKFSVYVGVAPADVIIDVTGYYSSDSNGAGTGIYRNVDSSQKTFRLYDSRPAGTNSVAPPLGAGDGMLAAGKFRSLQVTGNLGIPASASAVVVNLTALNTTGAAFFNLYPSDAIQPGVASLTFIPGSPALVGNLALVPLSVDGKVALAAGGAGSADAILDVVGYIDTVFSPASNNGLYTSLANPTRLLDTRPKGTNLPDPPLGAGKGAQAPGTAAVRNFVASGLIGIPINAIALVAQVTMVDVSGPSFIGLYSGTTWPGTVAVASAAAGQLPGNLSIIPLDNGGSFKAIIGANASGYIIDVVGYITGS